MKFTTVFGIMIFASSAMSANAQSMPKYDPATHCKGVSEYSGGSSVIYKGCIEMEQTSYDSLKSAWSRLTSKTRNHCEEVARYSDGSYVVLKGCVDMEADAAASTPEFKF
ncbi:hypothetical protein [Brucella intermedia]|uniref:hypothetical protein n=1 Tax=Brucella intermedia TaxID=94625 RepID=UPI002248E094|nr:hypothetical protein [Brucella intermedia]